MTLSEFQLQGVIFSINCSIAHNLITTTSDDRSVKMWHLRFSRDAPTDWSTCTIEPSKSMFGHIARIFSHKIINYNNQVYIITVGEDSNVCIWSCDGRLVNRQAVASNVSLWNLDYDSTRQYLFACGNDGNVYQLNLNRILSGTQYWSGDLDISGLEDGEFVKKWAVMQDEAIAIFFTSKKNIFYGKVEEHFANYSFKRLPDAETDYKINTLETHGSLVATAGDQFVTIYQYKNGAFKKVFHEKPTSNPQNESTSILMSFVFISEGEFVICDVRGRGALITIDESFSIVKSVPFEMPPCKERWITMAARYDNYLIVSDRRGHMHLFELNDRSSCLKHTLWNVNGNQGCRTIFNSSTENTIQFDCAGHQGKIKTIVINSSMQQLELKSTHDIPITWCEKSLVIDKERNILLAGFNERNFVAWRIDNSFRFEIECGGGHRGWDLYIDRKTSKAHLLFARNKINKCVQFYLHDNSMHPFNIATTNWHSRPCNTMRLIELTNERYLIASGGDDNLLKFNEISTSQSTLTHRFDMVLHNSNIRSVCSLELSIGELNESKIWLIFSAGGRAQICVTEVKIDQNCSVQFREVCDFMLRSSDLERKRMKQTQVIYFDPETRFMSLETYKTADGINLVSGCSDGFIRTFRFANDSITLNGSVFYGRCFLNVYTFEYNCRNYLITMATDGLIAFWSLDDFNEDSLPFFNVQHHDSGVNSFDTFIRANKIWVATGGDDQAIAISILQIESLPNGNGIGLSVDKTIRFPYNHTAQVNGVRFSADRKCVYSVSVDQNVMRVDLSDFSIGKINYSCISDAKGLCVIDSNNILVYGCGMQVLNV